MDRFALCRALEEAGVPATSYEIADCPGRHRAADRYFLDGHDGDWTVGVHERGTRQVFERFADEGEACRWIHDRLLGGEPSPTHPAPAPGEPAGPGPDPEALRRQADDELEAALTELRRRAAGTPGREHPGKPAEGDGPA
ncbi:hypothetical protein OG410_28590 [Streptomyces sp. NBC_00659]|uniref:hypothetical protein n=1 Tax=Streptomyces sp. NBC_00659 TaxID=2903669 RepID=UPI002E37D253|nr:hypothetical protein [Streptomyces sp. NBC_00659]